MKKVLKPSECMQKAITLPDGTKKCPCGYVIGPYKPRPAKELPWWVKI